MYLRVIKILLFSIYCSFTLGAENVTYPSQKIETFVSEQGFFQNSVNDITTDKYGFLWVATPNGLVRYDGYAFEYVYHSAFDSTSIPDNYISQLLKDDNGNLWINTRHGLCFYESSKEVFTPCQCDLFNIKIMKADAKNRVWIVKGRALHIFESVNDENYPIHKIGCINLGDELKKQFIIDIEFLSESELLIATSSNVFLLNIDESNLLEADISSLRFKNEGARIIKIIKKKNLIWVGTNDGLFQTLYQGKHLKTLDRFFVSEEGKVPLRVTKMFVDAEDKLWIGTRSHGILVYNNADFLAFKHDPKQKDGLTSNRINSFYEDDFGIMWVGTAQGGINKIDRTKKNFYNYSHNPYDDESLASNLVTDIIEGADGRIWMSSFDNSVCRTSDSFETLDVNDIKFESIDKLHDALHNKCVVCIYQDTKLNWWIVTDNGLYLYNERTDKLKKLQLVFNGVDLDVSSSHVVTQNVHGQIIIGGRQLYQLDNPWSAIAQNKPIVVSESFFNIGENNPVFVYTQDSFGNHWLGTRLGLYQLDYSDGQWEEKNFFSIKANNQKLKLSHRYIFSLHIDRNKNLWIGTFGGGLMNILLGSDGQPSEIKQYHKEDGLPDEVVYGIMEDESGDLWLSTDMGIARFNTKTSQIETYNTSDGIFNNNFRQSAFLKTKSGIMIMGGVNGLTIFDPRQIKKNVTPPKVLISRLKVNDKKVFAGSELDGDVILNSAISDAKKLRLQYKHRNISFEILVLHTATPQNNKVLYMLEGVNDDWVAHDGGKAIATYTNLSAGTYRFLYKGTSGDGIWTPTMEELEVTVLAPWFRRWWSLTIWLLLLIALIYFVFVYVLQHATLQQQLDFERLDKERENEMHQAKIRFFTNISHDIKTPLSLIVGPLEKIGEDSVKPEDQKYFSIIKNNISRLQRLIDQLTSYRKAETGHLNLAYSKISVGDFIYPLLEAFDDYAQRAHVNFYHKVNLPNSEVVIDIDKTERILFNLFFNAMKYSDVNPQIRVEVGFDEAQEHLCFIIADNGIGIPPDKIDKVFDRFYRAVDDRENWSGSGIGLALCKSLLDLMEGDISVESSPGKETIFKFQLPLRNDVELVESKGDEAHRKVVLDWVPSEVITEESVSVDMSRPTILIVDDEVEMRTFLFESFKNQYNVILAVDGQDGLEKLEKHHPKLIVSDVMMPKMDGYQFCEKVKSDMKTCHIPVILLTALGQDDHVIKGLEFGADVYIRKPFSVKHLEVSVRKLIENRQQIFNYFSENSIVTTNDALEMSPKERKFLEDLMVIIEREMANSDFGVEELAKQIGMSTSSFYRKLKKLTGQTPSTYLRNYRLQRAAELLKENTDLNVTEVMFDIGIESASYFSSSFKKLYGMNPSTFIKSIRGN